MCQEFCPQEGCAWQGGHAWQGLNDRGIHGRGYVWQGVHSKGGMHGKGGMQCKGGMHGGGGACVAGETATAADGTHPTGMHSCLFDDNLLVTSGTRFNETVLTLISIRTVLFLKKNLAKSRWAYHQNSF